MLQKCRNTLRFLLMTEGKQLDHVDLRKEKNFLVGKVLQVLLVIFVVESFLFMYTKLLCLSDSIYHLFTLKFV